MRQHGALTSRYLSIQEPASRSWTLRLTALLETHFQSDCRARMRCPLFAVILARLVILEDGLFHFLIMNEKTSFLLSAKNEVHCVDTHSYPPHGANVIVSDSVHVAKFCET